MKNDSFEDLMSKLEAMQMVADIMPRALIMAVSVHQSRLSLEEWWGQNMTCTCGECQLDRFEELWEVYREMIVLFMGNDQPTPAQIRGWVENLVNLRKSTESLRMAMKHLHDSSAN